MANSRSASKRARQAETRRRNNMGQRSFFRTAVKRVVNAIADKDKTAAESAFKAAEPVIDSMANKGIVSKNKASRHKHRLSLAIRNL